MNDILRIPAFQRRKLIPTQKKDFELTPYNKSFGSATSIIIGDDDFRPAMSGNYFDNEHKSIVGTDAHKLYHIREEKYTVRKGREPEFLFDGIYQTIQSVEKSYNDIVSLVGDSDIEPFEQYLERTGKLDEKFPRWQDVIPPISSYEKPITIDNQKLYWYASVLNSAKVLLPDVYKQQTESTNNEFKERFIKDYNSKKIPFLKDSYTNFINPTKKQIHLQYDTVDIMGNRKKAFISVNALYLANSLKFGFWIGNSREMLIGGGKQILPEFINSQIFVLNHTKALFINFGNPFNNKVEKGTDLVNHPTYHSYTNLDKMNDDFKFNQPYILLMPLMLEDYTNLKSHKDIEIGNIDMDINSNMVYDLNTNTIFSNGEEYEIDESLGYKPKYNSNILEKTETVISKDKKDLTSPKAITEEIDLEKIKKYNKQTGKVESISLNYLLGQTQSDLKNVFWNEVTTDVMLEFQENLNEGINTDYQTRFTLPISFYDELKKRKAIPKAKTKNDNEFLKKRIKALKMVLEDSTDLQMRGKIGLKEFLNKRIKALEIVTE